MDRRKALLACFLVCAILSALSLVAKTRFLKSSRRQAKQLHQHQYVHKYLPYKDISIFLQNLSQQYPSIIKSKIVGKSSQGRKIRLYSISSNDTQCQFKKRSDTVQLSPIRIKRSRLTQMIESLLNKTHYFVRTKLKGTNNNQRRRSGKPVIFIDGGAHSREWVSPAAILHFMSKLVENNHLTQNIDWKIIPLVNPDGYIHSWKKDRFWRKTVSTTPNSTCFGADINRNFDIFWGEVDTSTNPCTENYGGAHRNSEPETKAIINSLTRFKKRLEAYISVHNWGQDILYPYSYTKDATPHNEDELRYIGQGMADSITKHKGVTYKIGMSSLLLYPASGTAFDWAYEISKVPLSYLLELRDDGTQGFQLDERYIKDTGDDLYFAMEYLAKEVEKKYEKIC